MTSTTDNSDAERAAVDEPTEETREVAGPDGSQEDERPQAGPPVPSEAPRPDPAPAPSPAPDAATAPTEVVRPEAAPPPPPPAPPPPPSGPASPRIPPAPPPGPPPPGPATRPARHLRSRANLNFLGRWLPIDLEGEDTEAVRRRRIAILAAAIPIGLLGLLIVGWAVDNAFHAGQVHRNVSLAGHSIGGASEDSLPAVISEIGEEVGQRPVQVEIDGQQVEVPASELGLALDEDAVLESAMAEGRKESFLTRPFSWAASLFGDRSISLEYSVSETQTANALQLIREIENPEQAIPAEPSVELVDGTFVARPGQPGIDLDAARAAEDLLEAAEGSDEPDAPLDLTVGTTEVRPTYDDDDAEELAEDANDLTDEGMTLLVDGTERSFTPEQLREWLTPDLSNEEEPLTFDMQAVNGAVPELFSDLAAEPTNATVSFNGGAPAVTPSQDGLRCCGENPAELIWDALQSGDTSMELEAEVVEPEHTTEEVEGWGIVEPVGGSRGWRNGSGDVAGPKPGFTTWEACCGARQHNIRMMADEVNGAVVPPGGSFSINDHVGARQCPPYQLAGAIREGEHVDDECGGGTSQFATTFMNAAFFAGVDITQYNAHSEYFGRYPRGREATMGVPGSPLDVAFDNNTDYGILIQTSYEGDSLTVTFWSTQHIQAEQTNISESRSGRCDSVTTTRTRTYPDGSTETDTFSALYRPGEGEDC